MKVDPKLVAFGVIGVAVVAGLWYAKKGVVEVAQAVNPFNNDNIINREFTDLYQNVTGSTGTLGTDAYDFLHPKAAEGTNIINGYYTSIYQKLTGSTGSIGTDIYDFLH